MIELTCFPTADARPMDATRLAFESTRELLDTFRAAHEGEPLEHKDDAGLFVLGTFIELASRKSLELMEPSYPPVMFLDVEGSRFESYRDIETWAADTFSTHYALVPTYSNGLPRKGYRARLILPLSRPMEATEASLVRRLLVQAHAGAVDQTCSDLTRGFWGPARRAGTDPHWQEHNEAAGPMPVEGLVELAREAGIKPQAVLVRRTGAGTGEALTLDDVAACLLNLLDRMAASKLSLRSAHSWAAVAFLRGVLEQRAWGERGEERSDERIQGTLELARAYPDHDPNSLAPLVEKCCETMGLGFTVEDIVRGYRDAQGKVES